MTFQVQAHYRARAHHADEVARLLAELAILSRAEEGNRSYEVFRSLDDPSHFVILEEYSDAAAFDVHRTSVHFAELGRAKIIPMLADRHVSEVTHAAV